MFFFFGKSAGNASLSTSMCGVCVECVHIGMFEYEYEFIYVSICSFLSRVVSPSQFSILAPTRSRRCRCRRRNPRSWSWSCPKSKLKLKSKLRLKSMLSQRQKPMSGCWSCSWETKTKTKVETEAEAAAFRAKSKFVKQTWHNNTHVSYTHSVCHGGRGKSICHDRICILGKTWATAGKYIKCWVWAFFY